MPNTIPACCRFRTARNRFYANDLGSKTDGVEHGGALLDLAADALALAG
jgi:hypothetical protein